MKKKLLIQGMGIKEFYSIYTVRRKYGVRIARVCKEFCLPFKKCRYFPVELRRVLHKYKKKLIPNKKGIRERYLLEQLKEELFYETARWSKRSASSIQSKNGDAEEASSSQMG